MKTTLYLTIPLMILVMTACNTKDNAGKYHTQDAMDAIFARTSIRSYQPQAVEEEKIELLLRAGMAAPSGKNVQPWELVVVDDRAALDAMAAAQAYAKMLAQAPMAIVVCADTTKSSYWYVDCSAVAENILLAAQALGLGAVWTATYPYADRMDVVAETLALPETIHSLCVIPVGYPADRPAPKDKWKPEKVHRNRW